MPIPCQRAAAIQKAFDEICGHIAEVQVFSRSAGESAQYPFIGCEFLTPAFTEGDVLLDKFGQLHSNPFRGKLATSRNPDRSTLA